MIRAAKTIPIPTPDPATPTVAIPAAMSFKPAAIASKKQKAPKALKYTSVESSS